MRCDLKGLSKKEIKEFKQEISKEKLKKEEFLLLKLFFKLHKGTHTAFRIQHAYSIEELIEKQHVINLNWKYEDFERVAENCKFFEYSEKEDKDGDEVVTRTVVDAIVPIKYALYLFRVVNSEFLVHQKKRKRSSGSCRNSIRGIQGSSVSKNIGTNRRDVIGSRKRKHEKGLPYSYRCSKYPRIERNTIRKQTTLAPSIFENVEVGCQVGSSSKKRKFKEKGSSGRHDESNKKLCIKRDIKWRRGDRIFSFFKEGGSHPLVDSNGKQKLEGGKNSCADRVTSRHETGSLSIFQTIGKDQLAQNPEGPESIIKLQKTEKNEGGYQMELDQH